MRRKPIFWLPFGIVLALFGAFYWQLKNPSDRVIVSQMVGKPLPDFAAPPAFPTQPGASTADYKLGKPRLINVFASWCIPCVQEVPVLKWMQQQGAPIDGIAIHDSTEALTKFLGENGNPYERIGLDDHGRFQIGLGSSGVPESFVVDGQGKIVYQHIGMVTPEDAPKLLAMLGIAQ